MPDDGPASEWIVPAWPAPANVRALMTTRNGGFSGGAWKGSAGDGLNLGLGSGDDPDTVVRNRALLARQLPSEPAWLTQVHGVRVVDAGEIATSTPPLADAAYTSRPHTVCTILVADCMPVLFTNRQGTCVAAAHAGWRGLVAGVLEATIAASGLVPGETIAWIGPAIGPLRFEVGDDVRDAFVATMDHPAIASAFMPRGHGKWMANLPMLASLRLAAGGVADVFASGLCTATDAQRFYSYRRDGVTGRMAASIWIAR